MADNSLFPRRSDIFGSSSNPSRNSILDIRDTLGRVSLDALYQVTFSFGKSREWLREDEPGKNRTQGTDFKRKMSLLCTQAEIPGTSFETNLAVGHHQGIQEEFPSLRNFPPLNLTFYVDADHVILEVLETWMTFINPITNNKRNLNAFGRFHYPEDYKEIMHITKFEKDTFVDQPQRSRNNLERGLPPVPRDKTQSKLTSYEFVNVWPTNLASMRVAYGDSAVLRCSVQLAYDRFFTKFHYDDSLSSVENTPFNRSNDNSEYLNMLGGRAAEKKRPWWLNVYTLGGLL